MSRWLLAVLVLASELGLSSCGRRSGGVSVTPARATSAQPLARPPDCSGPSQGLVEPHSATLGTRGVDFDADGYADFAIAHEATDDDPGEIYVYGGSPHGWSIRPRQIIVEPRRFDAIARQHQGLEEFAESLASVGDVTGDHIDDLLVQTWYANGPGRVLIYAGSPSGLSETPTAELVIPPREGHFKQLGAIRPAGDVDFNGSPDFVIGQVLFLTGRSPAQIAVVDTASLMGAEIADGVCAVIDLRDFDGDGRTDLACQNTRRDGSSLAIGWDQTRRTLVLKTSPVGVVSDHSVESRSDFDGDGVPDAVCKHANSQKEDIGESYRVLRDTDFDLWIELGAATQRATQSMPVVLRLGADPLAWQEVGDTDGDGFDDLLVFVPRWEGSRWRARLILYRGGPSGLSSARSTQLAY